MTGNLLPNTAPSAHSSSVWVGRLWDDFLTWAHRVHLAGKVAIGLTLVSVLAGIATYAVLTETPPLGRNPTTVTLLLTLDLILLLALGVLIARRVVNLFIRLRKKQAGSRLHLRLVAIFSLLAITPAILVGIFSAIFFYIGIQSWFSDKVRTAVNESLAVAQAYLSEHQQVIKADALAMAADLNREAAFLQGVPLRFNQLVANQAALRGLSEVIVFEGSGRIVARSGLSFALEFEPIQADALEQARRGEVVLMIGQGDDRVRALLRLDNYVDTFLFVGRLVEPRVLAHMASAQKAVDQYTELEGQSFGLQLTVTLIFGVVSLLLLLVAIWFGLNFATHLVAPISALIGAAERVRAGDLTARVIEPEGEPRDELANLSRAFNRMTSQLEAQRRELIDANRQLDTRRRFTEAVLSGVSAGILGLDSMARITACNASAARLLLEENVAQLQNRYLLEIVPEMAELLSRAQEGSTRFIEGQIELTRGNNQPRSLFVRISAEKIEEALKGYVVTFDDVSDLLTAQRKAAWADIARRIAHEIKNPLTPIQLSAERLKRRYLKEITSDPETFTSCTDTIIRQVGDIGRMVDEFSAFARMPAPVFKLQNISELCRQALFAQSTVTPHIAFESQWPASDLSLVCDGRQIAQALANLLKNAAEAVDARDNIEAQQKGRILLTLEIKDALCRLVIADNGKGLPKDERHRLTEPYVTTRTKGTGLGLAIVKKIMEDHRGRLILEDNDSVGARVTLQMPTDLPPTKLAPTNLAQDEGHATFREGGLDA